MNPLFTVLIVLAVVFIAFLVIRNIKPTDGCKVTGCSGQICADRDIPSTCEYKCEYSCYRNAKCKKINGACGWELNPEFYGCLRDCRRREMNQDI